MRPPEPDDLAAQAEQWDGLSRWERAELGRDLRRLVGPTRKLVL